LKFTFLSSFNLPNKHTKASKRATTAYIYKHFQSKLNKTLLIITTNKGEDKAVPLQAWSGPEGPGS
jgi:hypothetical protein